MKRKKILVFTVIGLALVGLGTTAFLKRNEEVLPVQTERVARRTITEKVVANGRIQPVVQVKISPEVSGEIIELAVKEGQEVKKGDLLLRIKPDSYVANRKSEEARFMSSQASQELAAANLAKADAEFTRNKQLFEGGLLSDSTFLEFKTNYEVARASYAAAEHQVEVARAALARSDEELSKTTIHSPITGTVSRLNSELGERVVGTAMMTGTEVMTIADLEKMEARVDIGEIDVVLIEPGQKASLEVDAFRDRIFKGAVTEIANSAKGAGQGNSNQQQQQEATRFEVRIRFEEKDKFLPGMSVTAEIETRSRTNVLAVPIQSVTTRLPAQGKGAKNPSSNAEPESVKGETKSKKRNAKDANEPVEVVFLVNDGQVKSVPVTRGISDDDYVEITGGIEEGQEVVSGGYKAISRDLEDGMKVKPGEKPAAIARSTPP